MADAIKADGPEGGCLGSLRADRPEGGCLESRTWVSGIPEPMAIPAVGLTRRSQVATREFRIVAKYPKIVS